MAVYNIGTRYIDFAVGGPRTWVAGGGEEPPPATTYRVIVAVGESNAGGEALTSSLSSTLQAPTSRVRILIPTNATFPGLAGTFQDMDIGTNNNLDHDGLSPSNHGWEAGFLDYLDANSQPEPIYYVQTGQGGSMLFMWENGTDYWNKAQARINFAKARIAELGIAVEWEIWLTIGINDFIAGSPISTSEYNTRIQQLIADIRTMIGVGTAARVRSPQFMPHIQTTYPAYCTVHEALPGSVSNMQIVAATDLPVQDIYHWSSAGYITLGGRMAAPA